jgi:hypothetical protein
MHIYLDMFWFKGHELIDRGKKLKVVERKQVAHDAPLFGLTFPADTRSRISKRIDATHHLERYDRMNRNEQEA